MSAISPDVAYAVTWPEWPRVDDRGIARYVTPQSNRWLSLSGSEPLSRGGASRYRDLAQAIYSALARTNIRYSLEEYHPSAVLQVIRTPPEVLVSPKRGTCLDLATLYCGLCSAYELLSLLIVIEGHALAAVSLTHGLREWNAYRPGRPLFELEPLTDGRALRALFDEGSFLPVECTGFAHDTPNASGSGTDLTFEQAVAAGRSHFDGDRRFRFAVDVAVAHYGWRVEPYPLLSRPQPGGWTTDVFRILSDAQPPLATHLRVTDFERLVKERAKAFVGREFVFEAIDRLLESPDFPCGYVLVRGEPGIGKTSLLCRLIATRGYLHHFNVAQQGIVTTRLFLANLCAQLVVRYRLPHSMLPADGFADSTLLSKLLDEAVKVAVGKPIVILVDALDEVEDTNAISENRLCLPPVLPEGVYFVLTSREKMEYRLDVDRREDIYLADNDPRNLADVATYIETFIRSHENMPSRIAEWNVTVENFTTLLTERSEGNFMYLVHVLNDIRLGSLTRARLERVEDLPKGLRAYYERHWRTMRDHDRERFERIYEPVLRILATVREPVSLGYVQELTGLDAARLVEVVRDWRPFLNESEDGAEEALYRVYHASFRDFLALNGGLKPFHRLIARNALAKIPGFLTPDVNSGKTEGRSGEDERKPAR